MPPSGGANQHHMRRVVAPQDEMLPDASYLRRPGGSSNSSALQTDGLKGAPDEPKQAHERQDFH